METGGMNTSVPTISITSHSPAAIGVTPVNKQYAILEENLKQLHDIVETVQHMKDENISALSVNNQVIKNGEQCIRLSYSCPSLIDLNSDGEIVGNNFTSSLLHADLSASTSTPCISLLHVKQRGESGDWRNSDGRIINALNNSVSGGEILRRRSWAALEDLSTQKELLDHNIGKQRRKTSSDAVCVRNSYSYDDRREKRRKRGSLFFRKKKDKTRKSSHLWISVTHGNLSSVGLCDWCSKQVEMKFALHCEGCLATVHQGSCIENISATDCPQKVKNSTKILNKTSSVQHTQNKTTNKKMCNVGSAIGSSQGNSPILNEEKEVYFKQNQTVPQDHIISYSEEIPFVALDFLDEGYINVSDLNTDPFLGLQDEESDTWTPSVSKDILKKLKEKEIKRQEHIYEFILTEKHHCLTLIVMKKIFVDHLKKYFQFGNKVDRMFPRLEELTEIHLKFLHNLRRKQKEMVVVDSISDILLEQFSGNAAERLKNAYGEFCSRHREAVDTYKDYLEHDRRFAEFVKYCQNNPLLKKKGIPECILFVTQRLTKYPLLIEPLIKTSKENKLEIEKLTKALSLVRDILTEVDSRVAEKEKEDRKLEIFQKIDAKSFTMYRGVKFKKSDVLSNNRKLRFEGLATLMQGRTKMQLVHVIVLSDVLLFLVENNNKFSFFTPDSKPGVVCLQKLLVREKAGADSRGIYLISSNPSDPEMFELKIHKPKDKNVWIRSIRESVRNCPEDDTHNDDDFHSFTYEEKQKKAHISQLHLHQIVSILRQKDVEQALIYEEKVALLIKLLAAAGVDVGIEPPSYCHLVSEYLDNDTLRKEVFNTIQKVNLLTTSLYASNTNLSRSTSSVGEKQSNAYVSPILPKRAETFGGFDNTTFCKGFVMGVGRKLSQQFQKKVSSDVYQQDVKAQSPSLPSSPITTPELLSRKLLASSGGSTNKLTDVIRNTLPSAINLTVSPQPQQCVEQKQSSQQDLPTILQLEAEQQSAVVQLISHIYTLASVTAQQMSSIDSLEARLAFYRQELNQPSNEKERRPIYKHNHQLEELRNLQDRLSQAKEQWQREKENEEKDLEEKRKQLLKLQEQTRIEQEDVTQQREQLYRKLERLSTQGVLGEPCSPSQPSGAVLTSPNSGSLLVDLTSTTSSSPLPPCSSASPSSADNVKRRSDSVRWKQPSSSSSTNVLSLNLMSATNQQKVSSSNVQIKQKLPLKLATGSKSGNIPTVGGNNNTNNNTTTTTCSVAIVTCTTTTATSTPTTGTSLPSAASPNVVAASSKKIMAQQILPWKLRECSPVKTNIADLHRSLGANSSGYERLVNTEPTTTTLTTSPLSSCSTSSSSKTSHSRTGSSPAMMQNIRVPFLSPSEDKEGGGSAKAERTNTFPKIPEKYHQSSGGGKNTSAIKTNKNSTEEKVIFF